MGGVLTTYKATNFDPKDKLIHSQEIVNAYILEKLQFYKITSKINRRSREYFNELLDEWTSAFYNTASAEVREELCDDLRAHSHFVNHLNRIDYALYDTFLVTKRHYG